MFKGKRRKREHEGTRKCFRCAKPLEDEEGYALTPTTIFCSPLCRQTPFACPHHGTKSIWAGETIFCGKCERGARARLLYSIVDDQDYWANTPTDHEVDRD